MYLVSGYNIVKAIAGNLKRYVLRKLYPAEVPLAGNNCTWTR